MPNPQPGQMEQRMVMPCPLCGGPAWVLLTDVYEVWCRTDNCLRLPPRATETEAIAAWNTRPTPDGEIGELVGEWRVLTETLSGRSFLQIGDDLCTALETQAADIARLREALNAARPYIVPGRLGNEIREHIDAALATRTDVR